MRLSKLDGLTSAEAARRLAEFGPNDVVEPDILLLQRIARHFWAPVPWMLEAAILLQIAIGERIEATVIGALLFFNVVLSFVQEGRASAALAALKSKLAINAMVKRDGDWRGLPAAALAPGDIVKLEAGSVVPADVRITEGALLLDQSMLTGESTPVEAGAGAFAYAGAMARRGEAIGEVVATGARSYFGKTAQLVSIARTKSAEQAAVLGVVRNLAVFNGVIIVLLIIYAHYLSMPTGRILALTLTAILGSVPVALPATFTLAAAMGAQALTRKGVLLTRLSALHEAATVDVLCVDKTGTLTKNELKIAAVKALHPTFSESDVLRLAALASATAGFDPVDAAIRAAAPTEPTPPTFRVTRFTPFDPASKFAEALVLDDEERERRIIKGAPAAIARVSPFPQRADEEILTLSRAGSRVLAIAFGPPQSETLIGMIALSDPPRPESKPLIARLRAMGVRPVMITGDAAATAASVGLSVGIDSPVGRAAEIHNGSDPVKIAIYAGVFPEDKFRLVKAFQHNGHTVGMCGDGVNDAPALRQAQMGVAVATATDVAKSAASVVLIEPGLQGVVAAIEEGRVAFQRILTYTLNALVKKIQLVPLLGVGLLLTGHAVITPLQMALLLITGDFLTMSVATDRATPSTAPDVWRLRAITGAAGVLGLFGLAFLIGVIIFAQHVLHLDIDRLRTLIFIALVFLGQAMIYVVRDRENLWRSRPSAWLAGSSALNVAIAAALAIFGLVMATLPPPVIGATFIATALFAFVLDGAKSVVFRLFGLVGRPPLEQPAALLRTAPAARGGVATWLAPALAAILLALGVLNWRPRPSPEVETSRYLFARVERGSVVRSLTYSGEIEAPTLQPVVASTSGVVREVSCDVGTKVVRGQICARLDDRAQRLLVAQEDARLAAIDSRIARLKIAHARRQPRLARSKRSSTRLLHRRYRNPVFELRRAEQMRSRLRADAAEAAKELSKTDIRTGDAGVVVERRVAIGQKASVDASTPLFLVDPSAKTRIALDVPRQDLSILTVDLPVSIVIGSKPQTTLHGEIARIRELRSEDERQDFHADVFVTAPKGRALQTNARVTAKIEIRRDDVLRVPVEALGFEPSGARRVKVEGPHLWVLRDDTPTPIPVKRGLDNGAFVEISGADIKEGDRIIVAEHDHAGDALVTKI